MQEEKYNKKRMIINALAQTLKELRGKKSQFIFASENDISISIISTIERGLKDPQLTTMFKLAEACNMSLPEFILKISEKLPKDFFLIDK